MRIAGGEKKGRRLFSAPDASIRPTSDKVRGAIFNVLGQAFEGYEAALDLFAGTGAMGIEALSRGVKRAVFVDNSVAAVKIIEKNVCSLELKERAVVIRDGAENAVKKLSKKGGERFDLVFVDAPYVMAGETVDVLSELAESGLLAAGAAVVCEAAKKNAARIRNSEFAGLTLEKEKTYGDTTVFFFRTE